MPTCQIPEPFRMPEALWERFAPLLPEYTPSPQGGQPRKPLRNVADAIYFVLRTGIQWKALPSEAFGVSGSSAHRYFQEWQALGLFEELWRRALTEYDQTEGIDWQWQAADGAMTKAPLGGENDRQKPDRSRQTRSQTESADRRSRHAAGGDGRRGQRQRPPAARTDAREHSGRASRTGRGPSAAPVSGQRV